MRDPFFINRTVTMRYRVPNYTFKSLDTGEEFVLTMSMSEREKYLSDNPRHEQILVPIPLADPSRLGLRKPDSAFRDILKRAKKEHLGSKINTW